MTEKKSYPVTTQVSLPQPHVTIVTEKRHSILSCGWVPFVLTGVVAIIWLFSLHYLGGTKLFPKSVKLYAGLVPIVKKGYLQVVPFTVDSNHSIQDPFFTKLPLKKNEQTEYVQALDQLINGYPDKYEEPYRNCWLENPTENHPCFYDRSWVARTCTRPHSYGYDIEKGEFSPCFILKFENPGDWKPLPPHYTSLFDPALGYDTKNFDHGFIPVVCVAQDETRPTASLEVEIYPPKGFSLLYFPVSYFNASLYLPPLVAVKVKGIQRNRNVTIDCSIITPNAFVLWNIGRVSITFSTT